MCPRAMTIPAPVSRRTRGARDLWCAPRRPASRGLHTPIGEVVQLNSDLQAKIIKEGSAAHKLYAGFAGFSEDRSKEPGYDIKTGNRSWPT